MKKILLCILFFVFFLTSCAPKTSYVYSKSERINLPDYKKDEAFQEGWFDFTDYYKYYYEPADEEWFEKEAIFQKVVSESDIEYIVWFVDDFKREVSTTKYYTKYYDFKKSQIKLGDYYHIDYKINEYGNYDNFAIYYYDVEKAILYVFLCSM